MTPCWERARYCRTRGVVFASARLRRRSRRWTRVVRCCFSAAPLVQDDAEHARAPPLCVRHEPAPPPPHAALRWPRRPARGGVVRSFHVASSAPLRLARRVVCASCSQCRLTASRRPCTHSCSLARSVAVAAVLPFARFGRALAARYNGGSDMPTPEDRESASLLSAGEEKALRPQLPSLTVQQQPPQQRQQGTGNVPVGFSLQRMSAMAASVSQVRVPCRISQTHCGQRQDLVCAAVAHPRTISLVACPAPKCPQFGFWSCRPPPCSQKPAAANVFPPSPVGENLTISFPPRAHSCGVLLHVFACDTHVSTPVPFCPWPFKVSQGEDKLKQAASSTRLVEGGSLANSLAAPWPEAGVGTTTGAAAGVRVVEGHGSSVGLGVEKMIRGGGDAQGAPGGLASPDASGDLNLIRTFLRKVREQREQLPASAADPVAAPGTAHVPHGTDAAQTPPAGKGEWTDEVYLEQVLHTHTHTHAHTHTHTHTRTEWTDEVYLEQVLQPKS